MPIIVEDGTGKTDANAYIDIEYLNQYMDLRGIENSTIFNEVKEAAIIVATLDYIDFYFSFKEGPLSLSQSLKAPLEESGVPKAFKDATALAAYLHTQGLLFVDKTQLLQAGQVKRSRRKLASLETENEFVQGTASKVVKYNPEIRRYLAPYLKARVKGLLRS